MLQTALAFALALALTMPAMAQPSAGGGTLVTVNASPALPITDDAYDGTLASMDCIDLDFSGETPHTINDAEPRLGVTHTWVGDLVYKLESPSGTVVTFLNRPGYVGPDDGTSGFGDSSNMQGSDVLEFHEDYTVDAENMGANAPTTDDLVCFDDGECEFIPNPDGAVSAAGGITDGFDGEATNAGDGIWHVCIGDAGAADTGMIDFVELTLQGDMITSNEAGAELPDGYTVSNAYPNPFNPQTQFTVEVAETQNVVAKVYNTLGQEVATIFDGVVAAGQAASLTFEANDLPSGYYVVQISGAEFNATRSVSLLK